LAADIFEERSDYLSYLLRLWLVNEDGHPEWRASLKSARTGRELGFQRLEELFEYLQRQTATVPSGQGHEAS
jgi:Arc/MetJ-type ribon-helix-helix transcriptional regulator